MFPALPDRGTAGSLRFSKIAYFIRTFHRIYVRGIVGNDYKLSQKSLLAQNPFFEMASNTRESKCWFYLF
jgi:hypothetical protein